MKNKGEVVNGPARYFGFLASFFSTALFRSSQNKLAKRSATSFSFSRHASNQTKKFKKGGKIHPLKKQRKHDCYLLVCRCDLFFSSVSVRFFTFCFLYHSYCIAIEKYALCQREEEGENGDPNKQKNHRWIASALIELLYKFVKISLAS